MLFRQVLHEEHSCASYLVGCPTMGVAAVIDPQGETERYASLATEHALRITDVIDTHVHADHPSAARELAAETGGTLYMSADAEVGFDFQPLRDGDLLKVGNRRMQVLATPGHTPEHVCLVVDDWFVLTGDTLFVGDVGRIDLALAEVVDLDLRIRAKSLHDSLHRLLELRDDIEIYPGHYAGSTCGRGMDGKTISTIGRERRNNPALQLGLEEFVEFQLGDLPPLPEDFHLIKKANLAREGLE